MAFEVRVKAPALKFIAALDRKRKQRIQDLVLKLKGEPVPAKDFDVIKLGGYDSHYRIRIGDIRMVYEVLWLNKSITIHFVGWRSNAY
ncbi:MAG: type II toxin-antitoxin system RelE family toxin [Candidatus Micrarchaeaceae archaeon]